jgi:cAMP phosphodiesterase
MFGDVEPDTISLSPRNMHVWSEAAPKIASGHLRGVFIECSYDDSVSNDYLYGHIAPRFMIEEMKCLANEVRKVKENKKRKREGNGDALGNSRRKPTRAVRDLSPQVSPRSGRTRNSIDFEIMQADGQNESLKEVDEEEATGEDQSLPIRSSSELPLKGLKIVIIHMKEKLNDGPPVGELILKQLQDYEAQARLGCEFVISKVGDAMYF